MKTKGRKTTLEQSIEQTFQQIEEKCIRIEAKLDLIKKLFSK